jgi:outer membrane protein TolC
LAEKDMRKHILSVLSLSGLSLLMLGEMNLPVPAQAEPFIAPSPAANVSSPLPETKSALSPAALLEQVLRQNPLLLSAQEAVAAARAEQKSLEASLWPLITLNGQFTAGTADRMSMPVPGIDAANMSMRPKGLTANLNLTAMYPLFTGGKFQAQIEAAKRRVEQSEAEYALKRLELITQTRTGLLTLRWLAAQQALLNSEILRQEEDLRLIEARLNLGKIPRYELLRARSENARLQQERNLILLKSEQEKVGLRQLAAWPQELSLAQADPLNIIEVFRPLPTPAEAMGLAQERAPQLKALQAQLAEAQTRVDIANSSYWPFIYLVGVYEQRVPERPEMNYTSGAALDLLIALPVFDGFKRDAEQARFQREASRLLNEYAAIRNQIQADIQKLLLEMQTQRANLEWAQSAVEQLAEEYRISRLRYASGKSIALELFEVGNQWRAARLNQLEKSYAYESARLRFEQLLALAEPAPDFNHASK